MAGNLEVNTPDRLIDVVREVLNSLAESMPIRNSTFTIERNIYFYVLRIEFQFTFNGERLHLETSLTPMYDFRDAESFYAYISRTIERQITNEVNRRLPYRSSDMARPGNQPWNSRPQAAVQARRQQSQRDQSVERGNPPVATLPTASQSTYTFDTSGWTMDNGSTFTISNNTNRPLTINRNANEFIGNTPVGVNVNDIYTNTRYYEEQYRRQQQDFIRAHASEQIAPTEFIRQAIQPTTSIFTKETLLELLKTNFEIKVSLDKNDDEVSVEVNLWYNEGMEKLLVASDSDSVSLD